MPLLQLNLSERNSALWMRLREHLEHELALLRAQNDDDRDPVATAHIRGEIARLKTLLALDSEPSEQPPITLDVNT